MSEEYGLEALDAYQLLTQVSESPVANVVDPNYTFLAKVAKPYLPRVDAYRGSTAACGRRPFATWAEERSPGAPTAGSQDVATAPASSGSGSVRPGVVGPGRFDTAQ